MVSTGYDKFKSCRPEETVDRIRDILTKNRIETEEIWVDSGVENICSVRINIKGTSIGQNGKGTDRAYARASGYAEFMERLQTGYLLPEGLFSMPGAEYLSLEELSQKGGELLEKTFHRIRHVDGGFDFLPVELTDYLKKWSFESENGKMKVIAFKNLNSGEMCYLPSSVLRAYYFTNGSCAGNNREEAMIQGMSEIAERYASSRILKEKLTPPVIPEKNYENISILGSAIRYIKRGDRYDIRIMDASLGMGLPVVACALADKKTAKVVLRFGAHPRFEIALERCLTEILQGRHLQKLENSPVFNVLNDENCDGIVNRFNFMKAAFGSFHSSLYDDNPSWQYVPFREAPADISGLFRFMQKLYEKLGWNAFYRDCSFLGFPTYQILVPGISMVFDFGAERLLERRRIIDFRRSMTNLKACADVELEEICRLLTMKRGFMLENTFSFISGLPVSPTFLDMPVDVGVLAGLINLKLHRNDSAAEIFKIYSFSPDGSITRAYPLWQLLEGNMRQEVIAALKFICPEGWVEEALSVIDAPDDYFPVLNCPDCANCSEKAGCCVSDFQIIKKEISCG